MEFKDFFQLMKNRISDGLDVPAFFRDLVAMITDVTEEARDTPKDPSSKLTKENTLRTYAKRGLSARFAKSIVYNLSPEMFIESLESRPAAVLKLLAEDYRGGMTRQPQPIILPGNLQIAFNLPRWSNGSCL